MTKVSTPLLAVSGASKRYGHVRALENVSFELNKGEVMALLGENGAGKSTLVKILAGIETADSGVIRVEGREVSIRDAASSRAAGIAVVQQELSLIGTLSVAENVAIGTQGRVTSFKAMKAIAEPIMGLVGLDAIDLRTPTAELTVAEQQLVEIARVLARDANIIILDEPTAALSEREIDRVKSVVRNLAAAGKGIIYVTHRLAEVFEITDRVTIFRNGRSQEPVRTHDLDMDALVARMLGRELEAMFPDKAASIGDVLLRVEHLAGPGLAEPLGFDVRAGEILGLAGQLGSGNQAVLRLVSGQLPAESGKVLLADHEVPFDKPSVSVRSGIAYCSDDRKRDGIFQGRSVRQNLSSVALGRLAKAGVLSHRSERRMALKLADLFQVDQSRMATPVETLSGGNQQKVALGRWMGIKPRVLLVDEPSRGVDVGARAEIYVHLRNLANEGVAIAFASSSLQEVLGLADRVITFYRGAAVGVHEADSASEEELFLEVTHPVASRASGE